jgi:hypothetical protein
MSVCKNLSVLSMMPPIHRMFLQGGCLLWLFLSFISCSKPETAPPLSSAKTIQSFVFNALPATVKPAIDSVQRTVTATLPIGTDVSKLVPTITVSPKATINPQSGIAQDFSKPVSYTITAEDGSTRIFIITLIVTKSTAKSIKSFSFKALSPAVNATIDSVKMIITATVPNGTDLTKLVPTIIFSDRSSCLPASGTTQDFSNPVKYVITAEDGSSSTYTVNIISPKSSAKLITSFSIKTATGFVANATIDNVTNSIVYVFPVGTDLTELTPTISLSSRATVFPASSVSGDFTYGKTYTVTAEDGSTNKYQILLVTIANKPAEIKTPDGKLSQHQSALALTPLFNTPGYSINLYTGNATCAKLLTYQASFDLPVVQVGTYHITNFYFLYKDVLGQLVSGTVFNSVIQITAVTPTTIEGYLKSGYQSDNYSFVEGKFTAIICK